MGYVRSLGICCFITYLMSASGKDYCNIRGCGPRHIACGNNGNFGKMCPVDATVIDLDPFQDDIVEMHNVKRNEIASGKVRPFKPAGRMAEMQWDDQLAEFALLQAKTCSVKHDKCRNTPHFHNVGQNTGLFMYGGFKSLKSDEWIVKSRISQWADRSKYTTMRDINHFPGRSEQKIGIFLVMANERSTHIGCAAVRFGNGTVHNFLLTCNYSANNFKGDRAYRCGKKPGSACKSGMSKVYKNLCSTSEVY